MTEISGEPGAVGGGAASGPLRVNSAEVGALASEVIRLWNLAGTLRPSRVLDGVKEAVPGGLLSSACDDLAARWDHELTDLHNALGYIADALRDSAHDYEQVDGATARSFAESPAPAPRLGEEAIVVPGTGVARW
jgi:hypothetical protein